MRAATLIGTTALAALLGGCGDGGHGGSGSAPLPAPSPAPSADPLQLITRVGIDPMGYALPLTSNCLSSTAGAALPELPGFTADGRLDEWSTVSPQLSDTAGDAAAGLDLRASAVARVDEDLVLAVPLAPTSGTALFIELGGMVVRKGRLYGEQRILVRWRAAGTGLEEWRDDAFVTVSDGVSGVVKGAAGLELRLSRRLLGDAATWPAFWIRLSTQDAATAAGDSTHAAFFPSLLSGDGATFDFSACALWSSQKGSFTIEHVIDRLAAAAPAGFSIDRAAEAAFQLVRFAYDATQAAVGGRALPIAKLYVVATTGAVGTPFVSLSPDTEQRDLAAAYGPLTLNVVNLDGSSAVYFPQGTVLRQALAHFLELHLQAAFPAAPSYLRRVVRTALTDQILSRYVGVSYWLDSYLPTVQPFLGADDTKAPEPLAARIAALAADAFPSPAARQAYAAATEAKLTAFGHLLATDYAGEALIDGWSRAAARQNAGESAESAWRKALAAGGTPEQSARLKKLWDGWLVEGAYDRAFAPAWLGDRDADGVPAFVERSLGTRDDADDSDNDGWNDIAEYAAGTDPKAVSDRPAAIMPDGSFGDWLELMPKHVIAAGDVRGGRGERGCPKAAAISHYAALVNRDKLVVGAHAQDFWASERRAKWEVVVDLPATNQQYLVTAVSGSRAILVKDGKSLAKLQTHRRAMALAEDTIEWVIDRQSLGVKAYFNKSDGIRLRIRTVFSDANKDHFCDETPWFGPAISP
jgi:hypothetical protein